MDQYGIPLGNRIETTPEGKELVVHGSYLKNDGTDAIYPALPLYLYAADALDIELDRIKYAGSHSSEQALPLPPGKLAPNDPKAQPSREGGLSHLERQRLRDVIEIKRYPLFTVEIDGVKYYAWDEVSDY